MPEVFEYLADGVGFWQTRRVHHPFLLPRYAGSGKKYHQKFAEIGFTSGHAEVVSFVEVLHLPTVGVNKLTPVDLSTAHLKFLAGLFEQGSAEFVFMPATVTNLLRETGQFQWLPRPSKSSEKGLSILRKKKGQTIFQMYHLSCYGWQLEVLNRQIEQIRAMVTPL